MKSIINFFKSRFTTKRDLNYKELYAEAEEFYWHQEVNVTTSIKERIIKAYIAGYNSHR